MSANGARLIALDMASEGHVRTIRTQSDDVGVVVKIDPYPARRESDEIDIQPDLSVPHVKLSPEDRYICLIDDLVVRPEESVVREGESEA
jgi:hypothetical protein